MKHISYVLQDEYDNLLNQKLELEKKYKEQSKRKREACEQGAETRHDNADYEDAEYQQNILGKRISDLNHTIQTSKILLLRNLGDNKVHIGSTVQFMINNQEFTYTIGGYPTISGRISYLSPLGKSLIGEKIGNKIRFINGDSEKEITILSIT